MSRFRFELAGPSDDAALRAFLRSSTMPGRIELAFHREPSYFAPGGRFGPIQQTIVCRDGSTVATGGHAAEREIVGMACRAVRDVHIDGRPGPIGYLSMLRSAERVRSGMLLARGYRYLRALHADGAAPCYLTTIADGNDVALDILTSNRAGLPRYRPAGRYLTFAIATRVSSRRRPRHDTQWDPGRDDVPPQRGCADAADIDIDEIVGFLAGHGTRRQFYPVVDRGDFDLDRTDRNGQHPPGAPAPAGHGSTEPTFAGIGLDDITVERDRAGRIVGTMALWDQRPFRQTVVCGYDRTLRAVRRAHNATARLHRRPRLPAPGERLDEGYVALTAIEGDDPTVAESLLDATLARAGTRGLDYVLFGCHETDPLVAVAERRSFLTYTTHVFVVSWPEIAPEPTYDRTLPIHLEVGCL